MFVDLPPSCVNSRYAVPLLLAVFHQQAWFFDAAHAAMIVDSSGVLQGSLWCHIIGYLKIRSNMMRNMNTHMMRYCCVVDISSVYVQERQLIERGSRKCRIGAPKWKRLETACMEQPPRELSLMIVWPFGLFHAHWIPRHPPSLPSTRFSSDFHFLCGSGRRCTWLAGQGRLT